MRLRLFAVALLATLVASACASGSASTTSTSSVADTTTSSSTSSVDGADENEEVDDGASSADEATAEASGEGESMAASSPIGAFFADGGGFQAALSEYRVQVEEAIVVCMAAQGFEFARSENNTRNLVQERQNDLTLREWTMEYGFGISTSFDSVTENLASNPNFPIFMALGEAERDVWAYTLNGSGVEELLGGPVANTRPLEEQGCIGNSIIETGGQGALEGLDGFGDIYSEGETALFERREMVVVVDAWTQCMSLAGFEGYATLDDPEADIREKFQAVSAPLTGTGERLSEEQGQALLDGDNLDLESLPGFDVEALRAVQDEEISLALADLDCYEAEVQATYEPLRDEYEQGLLTEYATEFDALKTIGS